MNPKNPPESKGYHDMAIELKESVLNMAYRFDGLSDGYVRYVEIRKAYQPAGLFISTLLVKDPQSYTSLLKEYRAVLGTLKRGSD